MTTTQRSSVAAIVLFLCALVLVGRVAHAQFENAAIARLYQITGTQPISGDIISFDKTAQVFSLSRTENDSNLFGVVVNNPVLVLNTPGGGVPVVSTGEVLVNVTTLGGPIAAGDQITSSVVPGKGARANGVGGIMLGTALEAFPSATAILQNVSSTTVYEGSIRVLLRIGPREQPATTTPTTTPAATDSMPVSSLVAKALKYVLAALVAIGSVFAAFRNFGASIRDGIVSVGRNPLAKSSIQSMVILNSVLIILVSAAGLFVGFAILLLPL